MGICSGIYFFFFLTCLDFLFVSSYSLKEEFFEKEEKEAPKQKELAVLVYYVLITER